MNKYMSSFVIIVLLAFCLCNNSLAQQHHIGDSYGGGIIFYLDVSGSHGLIAAPTDLPGTYNWGQCIVTEVQGTSTVTGSGFYNTESIVDRFSDPSFCTSTIPYAAKACQNYSISSYSRWYLPSRDELYILLSQRSESGINFHFVTGNVYYYWSSSEYSSSQASAVRVTGNGATQFTQGNKKTYSWKVRPIRAF